MGYRVIQATDSIKAQELCTKIYEYKISDLPIKITVDKNWPHESTNDIIRALPNATIIQSNWRKGPEDKIPTKHMAKSKSN